MEMEAGDVFLPEAWKVTGGSAAAVREILILTWVTLLDLLKESNGEKHFLNSPW